MVRIPGHALCFTERCGSITHNGVPRLESDGLIFMAESTAPAPDNSANPDLQVMPDPTAKRSRSDLNQAQQAELTKAAEICTVALKVEYASGLARRGITNDFVTTLANDILVAGGKARTAVESGHARKAATRIEKETEQKLVESLRELQAAARQKHLPENPALLGQYYVGQDLAANRPTLEAISQNVINKANEERPPGVDTGLIVRVTNERTAYVKAGASQTDKAGKAKLGRAERESMVKDIIVRRKKIQYAADAQWPARKPQNVQARVDFKLPAKRPYSY